MKLLLDECIDWRLKLETSNHDVKSVKEMGWLGKKNGELLSLIAEQKFLAFITIDKRLVFQQNVESLKFGIIILDSYRSTLKELKSFVPEILQTIDELKPGIIVVLSKK